MRAVLLGLAAPLAALAFAAPADAQPTAGPAASVQSGFEQGGRDGGRHDRGRHRRGDRVVVMDGFWGSPEAWALYNNRSFAPDSFNDWWHDRPDRAYPRWMQNNQNCDRMWWGGGVWRCSW